MRSPVSENYCGKAFGLADSELTNTSIQVRSLMNMINVGRHIAAQLVSLDTNAAILDELVCKVLPNQRV